MQIICFQNCVKDYVKNDERFMKVFVGYYNAIIKTNALFMGFFYVFSKTDFVYIFLKTDTFVLYRIFYCY